MQGEIYDSAQMSSNYDLSIEWKEKSDNSNQHWALNPIWLTLI